LTKTGKYVWTQTDNKSAKFHRNNSLRENIAKKLWRGGGLLFWHTLYISAVGLLHYV